MQSTCQETNLRGDLKNEEWGKKRGKKVGRGMKKEEDREGRRRGVFSLIKIALITRYSFSIFLPKKGYNKFWLIFVAKNNLKSVVMYKQL